MVQRKAHFHGRREYFTFGDGFPGFGETDELKAARWNADLFEKAPVSEPENDPVAYTGDEDFPTRGRYSGVGVIVDEGADFDPEPASCDGVKAAAASGAPKPAAPASKPGPAAPASKPAPAAPANSSKPAASVEAKLDLSMFRELYRSRDGRLVFFEHRATGHLAALDASKLV